MNSTFFLLLPVIAVVVTAPFGATILGWMAVSQIRRSEGNLCGMGLALFAGLVFPLLALDGVIGLISYKLYMATTDLTGGRLPDHEIWIVLAIILSVMADISIVFWAWRAVNKPVGGGTVVPPVETKPHVSLGWVFGVAGVHALVFAGVAGFFLFVPPHYVAMFKNVNMTLPVLTQFVISISELFKHGWFLFLLPLAGLNLLILLGLRFLRIRALFWTWAIAMILVCAVPVGIGYASLKLASKQATHERARQEQRAKISRDLSDAIRRQFKHMGIQRYQMNVGLNSNGAEPKIRLENVQQQKEIAGSNVWVAVKGSLHARDLGGGNWEVTGSEELGDVHLAVQTAPLPDMPPGQQLAGTDWMLQPATTNVYYENKYWQLDVGVLINGRPARQDERRELAGRLKGIYKASAPNGGGEQNFISGFWRKNGVEGLTLQVTPDPGQRLNPGTQLAITITDSKSKRQQRIFATIPDDELDAQEPESGKPEQAALSFMEAIRDGDIDAALKWIDPKIGGKEPLESIRPIVSEELKKVSEELRNEAYVGNLNRLTEFTEWYPEPLKEDGAFLAVRVAAPTGGPEDAVKRGLYLILSSTPEGWRVALYGDAGSGKSLSEHLDDFLGIMILKRPVEVSQPDDQSATVETKHPKQSANLFKYAGPEQVARFFMQAIRDGDMDNAMEWLSPELKQKEKFPLHLELAAKILRDEIYAGQLERLNQFEEKEYQNVDGSTMLFAASVTPPAGDRAQASRSAPILILTSTSEGWRVAHFGEAGSGKSLSEQVKDFQRQRQVQYSADQNDGLTEARSGPKQVGLLDMDAHQGPVVLDLASGELLSVPKEVKSQSDFARHSTKIGKGDLAWDGAIITLRGARLSERLDDGWTLRNPEREVDGSGVHRITVPTRLRITTAERVHYIVDVREKIENKEGVRIDYCRSDAMETGKNIPDATRTPENTLPPEGADIRPRVLGLLVQPPVAVPKDFPLAMFQVKALLKGVTWGEFLAALVDDGHVEDIAIKEKPSPGGNESRYEISFQAYNEPVLMDMTVDWRLQLAEPSRLRSVGKQKYYFVEASEFLPQLVFGYAKRKDQPLFGAAIEAARVQAYQDRVIFMMKQYAQALAIYELNTLKLPPDLDTLIASETLPEKLRTYLRNGGLMQNYQTGAMERPIYHGSQDLRALKHNASKFILLAASSSDPQGKRLVGFLDGSVKDINESEYQEQIAEQTQGTSAEPATISAVALRVVKRTPAQWSFLFANSEDRTLSLWFGSRKEAVDLFVPQGPGTATLELRDDGLVLEAGAQTVGPMALPGFVFAGDTYRVDSDGSVIVGECAKGAVGIRVSEKPWPHGSGKVMYRKDADTPRLTITATPDATWFNDRSVSLAELETELKKWPKDAEIQITADPTLPYQAMRAILDICRKIEMTNLVVRNPEQTQDVFACRLVNAKYTIKHPVNAGSEVLLSDRHVATAKMRGEEAAATVIITLNEQGREKPRRLAREILKDKFLAVFLGGELVPAEAVSHDPKQGSITIKLKGLSDLQTEKAKTMTKIFPLTAAESPVMLHGMLANRTPEARAAALDKFGGSADTEAAVLRALRWLARNQAKDGSWGMTKPSMTALALLAYLGHGETPRSDEFGSVVEAGLRFLLDAQELTGHFKGRDGHDYTHPMATYALAEAYAMTRHPAIKAAVVSAMQEIVNGQNASGGFNYNLKPSTRNDTSYMAWCIQALSAGQNAGLSNDVAGLDRAMEKAVAAFRGNYQEDDGFGGFGYTGPSTSSGLSGAGAYSMQLVGEARSKEVRNTLPMIAQRFPFDWENPNGRSPLYYWYYNTQAFFHEGGAAWDDWNKQFSSGLVKAQTVTGNGTSGYVDHNGHPQELGYWTSPTPREHNGGNGEVMDTILCTLMLEVYYRYLPILQATTTEDSKGDVKWKSESSAGGDGKPAPQHMKGAPTHSIIGYPTNISASDLDRVRGGWKKEKEWHGQPLNITGGAGHGSWVFKSETPMYLCLRHEKVEDGESTITDLWSEEAARDFTVMIHHRSEKVTQRLTESGFSFERFRDQASWMYSAGGKSVGLNGTWQPPPSATSPSTVYSLLGKRVPLDAGERVTLLSSSWEGIDKTFILSVLFSPDPPEKTGIVNSKEQRKDTSEHNNDLQVTK